jgi:hypothetical protein
MFKACITVLFAFLLFQQITAQKQMPVSLHWLDQTPPSIPVGLSWGVPFERGSVRRTASADLDQCLLG